MWVNGCVDERTCMCVSGAIERKLGIENDSDVDMFHEIEERIIDALFDLSESIHDDLGMYISKMEAPPQPALPEFVCTL